MSTGSGPRISEVLPSEAWAHLEQNSDAVLVDVRSKPEWGFVGVPDLSTLGHSVVFAEWARFPGMSANPDFTKDVMRALDGAVPSAMLFLCRSGSRSLSAAAAIRDAFKERGLNVDCINVAEGFEGDLDSHKKRGGLNGWKARGLPWQQT